MRRLISFVLALVMVVCALPMEVVAEEIQGSASEVVTTAPADTKPADTGIVLAVLPIAIAAAAVVVSKRK